ncbi:MAG TPA: NUDIX domain-containing protein [Actinoplanes sp.]|nr:NUDIX domain-containing protein [Actinoplanes sp.]
MEERRRAAAVIVRDGRVLMVHERSRRSGGGEWWTLPGGGLRPGETAEEALRREVFDETGLVISDARYVLEMPYPSGMTSVFSVTVADGEPRLGRDDGFGPEKLGIDWLPVPELPIETSGVPVPPLMVVLPTLPGQGQPNSGPKQPTDPEPAASSDPGPAGSERSDLRAGQSGPESAFLIGSGQEQPAQVPAQHRKHGLPKDGVQPDRRRPGSALPRQTRTGQGRGGQLRPDQRPDRSSAG